MTKIVLKLAEEDESGAAFFSGDEENEPHWILFVPAEHRKTHTLDTITIDIRNDFD